MKKIVSVVLLVSLLVLMVVGCSDDNIISKTIIVKNETHGGFTYIELIVTLESEVGQYVERLEDPPNILENGGVYKRTYLFDKTQTTEVEARITMQSHDLVSDDYIRVYFTFDVDSDEDVTLTVRVEDGDLTITGSGSGYFECPIN